MFTKIKFLMLAVITASIFTTLTPGLSNAQCTGDSVFDPDLGCVDPGENPSGGGGSGNVERFEFPEPTPLPEGTVPADNTFLAKMVEIMNFLSVGVAIVATITVAIAGAQYSLARGDPNKSAAAINRLTQVGIAIFTYVFGLALLNWLVPGGAF